MKNIKLGGPAKLFISILLILGGYYTLSRITTFRGDLADKPVADEPEQEYIAEQQTGLVTIECWLSDLGIPDIDLGGGPREFEVEAGTRCSDLKEERKITEELEKEQRNQEYEERLEQERLAEIEEQLAKQNPVEPKFYIFADGTIERAENIPEILEIPDIIDGIEVKQLGNQLFKGMGIKEVYLPATIEVIGVEAFKNNELKDLVLPENLKVVDDSAFLNNELLRLTLNEGLEMIEGAAFKDNNLTYLRIPESVGFIGNYAFNNNSIIQLDIEEDV
ncbi:hypothetical protein IRB23SM22_07130 [Alkalibacterium sp. s-m-22]